MPDAYKPPLHGVVDDDGVEYTDDFNYDDLPDGDNRAGNRWFVDR